MIAVYFATIAVLLALTYAAWRRYLWAAGTPLPTDNCPYSLTEVFGDRRFVNVPHQKGVRWLTEIFSRSARKFPHLTALHIPHTGESLTFSDSTREPKTSLRPFLHFSPAPIRWSR